MASPLRVLMVEDRAPEAERMAEALHSAGVTLEWRRAETESDYLSAILVGADVILAKSALPQFGAFRALHLLHEHAVDIPFIVVTDNVGDECAVECMKRCASDYLLKDQLARLAPAVTRAVELKRARDAKRLADMALRARTTELAQSMRALERQSVQLRILMSELVLAEERERRRLAELLHDGLQQLLLAARIRLVDLEHHEEPRVRDASVEVIDLLEEVMENARTLTAELSPTILYTGGLVSALQWLARWIAKTHALKVTVRGDEGDLPPIDESLRILLFQSVRELLFNTVKHGRVRAAHVEIAQQAHEVRIRVSDAGVGFRPGDLRAEGGTSGGFGLFSIRQRLELLGGRMEIDSAPGYGSRFLLVAPLRRDGMDGLAGVWSTLVPSREIRVLVVSGNLLARQILSRILEVEPNLAVVGVAADGRAAVELVRERRPDVVTMDLGLAQFDGIDATRRIHAEFPDVRVIGLAMFEESDQVDAMRAAGAVDCLTNCGPSDALIAAIHACGAPGTRSVSPADAEES